MKILPAWAAVTTLFLLAALSVLTAQTPDADILRSTLLTNQAEAAAKQQHNKEALDLYEQATELNTKNGAAWTGLGRLTYNMGDVDRAKSFLKEGWACGDAGALRTLASLALLEGDSAGFEILRPDLMKQKDSDVEIRAILVLSYKKAGKMTSQNLDPVLAGLDLTQLKTISKADLTIFQEAFTILGRKKESDTIQTELNQRK